MRHTQMNVVSTTLFEKYVDPKWAYMGHASTHPYISVKRREWTKKKYTDVFKSGGNILGQSALKR